MGGDSGSVWLAAAEGGQPTDILVGLHFAGEAGAETREHAVACYADAVCKKLQVQVTPPGLALIVQPVAEAELGYDPTFVGGRVDPPEVTGTSGRDLVVVSGSPIVRHTHFSLAVNGARRFAQWVAWNIDGGRLRALSRRGLRFTFDPAVDERYQVGNDVYAANRLDRGHIARRADVVWGGEQEAQRANRESFYFTNIMPQHEGFNQSDQGGLWGRLENAIFEDVDVLDLRVSVLAGPAFGDRDVAYRGVRIPREFWKVIVFVDAVTGTLQAKGFVLTQADLLNRIEALGLEPFRLFRVPLADIETRASLDFGSLKEADTALPVAPSAARRRRRRRRGEGEAEASATAAPTAGIVEITSLDQISR
jgi:endonuclease G